MLKKFLRKLLPIIDITFIPLLLVSAPIFKAFAILNGKKLPRSRQLLRSIGVYPIRDHYYQPLFQNTRLRYSLRSKRNLPGIKFNENYQLNFLKNLSYSDEILNYKIDKILKKNFYFDINNGSFKSGDAEFLYQIIRHFKPKNIIEIGSGNSTRIASLARIKNEKLDNVKTKHICIEPYRAKFLDGLNGVKVIENIVEKCDKKIFNSLSKNDLLFIDSSHIIRPQGDVLFEYLELLPILNQGVIVHIHDIFTPRDYLNDWFDNQVLLWNEQYLLEALLSNTNRYEILAALNFLKHDHYKELSKVCPFIDENREPGSIYLRIKGN